MKLLLCLAMSLGLSAILYFYMKQKISNIEHRLNTLSDVVQTLADEFCKGEVKTISNIPLDNSLYDVNNMEENESSEEAESEESDGETDYDSDSSSDEEQLIAEDVPLEAEPKVEQVDKQIEFIELNEPEPIVVHKDIKTLEIKLDEPEAPLIKVSDDDVLETKHIQVSVVDYSHLSLKDLKQKVSDLGGPPLKTKPALLNFLKNKV
jgi:hypothetical protein